MQWVNLFPEIKDHLMNIFERYTHVLDAELQQRACEYLALAQRGETDDLLSTICDEMPVFPERESTLVNRLHRKGEGAQDKRTWVIGHSTENKERESERFKAFRKGQADAKTAMEQKAARPAPPAAPAESSKAAGISNGHAAPPTAPVRAASLGADDMMGTTANDDSDILTSLADLDLSGSAAGAAQEEPLVDHAGASSTASKDLSGTSEFAAPATVNGTASSGMQHVATLGGVAPALLAPLTVAPKIEKVTLTVRERLHADQIDAVAGTAQLRSRRSFV